MIAFSSLLYTSCSLCPALSPLLSASSARSLCLSLWVSVSTYRLTTTVTVHVMVAAKHYRVCVPGSAARPAAAVLHGLRARAGDGLRRADGLRRQPAALLPAAGPHPPPCASHFCSRVVQETDERRVLTELTSAPWPGLLNRWRGRAGGCRRPPPASTRCGCRRARPPSPHDDRPSTRVGGLDFGLHLPKAAPSRAGAASEVAGAGTRARRRSGSGCGPRWPTPRASTSTPSRSERGA